MHCSFLFSFQNLGILQIVSHDEDSPSHSPLHVALILWKMAAQDDLKRLAVLECLVQTRSRESWWSSVLMFPSGYGGDASQRAPPVRLLSHDHDFSGRNSCSPSDDIQRRELDESKPSEREKVAVHVPGGGETSATHCLIVRAQRSRTVRACNWVPPSVEEEILYFHHMILPMYAVYNRALSLLAYSRFSLPWHLTMLRDLWDSTSWSMDLNYVRTAIKPSKAC